MDSLTGSNKKVAYAAARDTLPVALNGIITPFIAKNPVLAASLGLAAAALGGVIVYRQERFNSTIRGMLDNPSVFTDKVWKSQDFQDGLVVHLDAIFKLRGEKKLDYAQRIFSDFAKSDSIPTYPLERYDDTLSKLSAAGIRFLGFIDTEIPRIKEEYLFSRMRQNGNSLDEKNIVNMRKAYIDNEPLSKFVNLWIEAEMTKEAKKIPNYEIAPLRIEDPVGKRIKENVGLVVSELEQLGLIRSFSFQTQGWDGGNTVSGYNLTHYGRMFTSVIKPEGADFMV
jgi:hypothetical protein